MKELTIDDLKSYLEDIFYSKHLSNRNVVIGQFCLEQGFVTRESSDLKLCSNPECFGCATLHKMLEEEAKKLITDEKTET